MDNTIDKIRAARKRGLKPLLEFMEEGPGMTQEEAAKAIAAHTAINDAFGLPKPIVHVIKSKK